MIGKEKQTRRQAKRLLDSFPLNNIVSYDVRWRRKNQETANTVPIFSGWTQIKTQIPIVSITEMLFDWGNDYRKQLPSDCSEMKGGHYIT